MPKRAVPALCLLLGLAACEGQPQAGPSDAAPVPTATASGQLTALPDCPPPPASSGQDVEGLVVPDGTVVTRVQQQAPLTNVTAFTPLTPAQFEASFLDMADITVLLNENEIYEAELLITTGSHRTFFKATATCKHGSTLLAVVAPEVDAEGLPLPQRATPTPNP